MSPTYAREVLTPDGGFGLHEELAAKGDRFVGILNGIDTEEWDPAADPHVPVPYDSPHPAGKDGARTALRAELGLPDGKDPLAVMVTRLVDQKGVDLVLPTLPYLQRIPMQFAVLGSGRATARRRPAARRRRGNPTGWRSTTGTTKASPTGCSPAAICS